MLDHLLITNAQIPGYQERQQIAIAEGMIQAVIPMSAPLPQQASTTLDLAGDWISWGGIDLQINGALGLAFPDLCPEQGEKLAAIAQFLWQHGVDGFLPTLVTTSIENIQRSLHTLANLPSPSSAPSSPSCLLYTS
ncbi:hypothetical protein ACN4EK_29050, partial [Pantanalinema rosaneae CENA516]